MPLPDIGIPTSMFVVLGIFVTDVLLLVILPVVAKDIIENKDAYVVLLYAIPSQRKKPAGGENPT